MAKLVAIGDSITQGFQSGAILRTTWSYPAMIARSLGLNTPTDFPIPTFPGTGLPLNIEEALHSMESQLGSEIDVREWIIRFPVLLRNFMNDTEEMYERGTGSRPSPFGGFYHNLAVWGFQVNDSSRIDGNYCQKMMKYEEGWIEDDFLGLPSAPMYRTALRVFNPRLQRDSRNFLTQLGNVRKIVETEQQLDCLILWLGANDCLGTVVGLNVKAMPEDIRTDDPHKRRDYNLTHPKVFERDYDRLITEIVRIIPTNTKVFVGTVPHVTIPPVTQGIPPFDGTYFEYYGRFYSNADNFNPDFQKHLKKADVEKIDRTIDEYNRIIRQIIEPLPNFHLVDIGGVLDSLAVKRNNLQDNPGQALQNYYNNKGKPNHPLLQLSPIPSVLRFELENDRRSSGGLFSLDCVHPSTLAYGIVAEVFLEEMQRVGVSNANPDYLDWSGIIAHDSLENAPPVLWKSVLEAAGNNAILWDVIFKILSFG